MESFRKLVVPRHNVERLGRMACRLGLHHWAYEERLEGPNFRTYTWCSRPDCFYRETLLVDEERAWWL